MKGGSTKTERRSPIRAIRTAPATLRVAVISDIHAYEGVEADKAPSHCCVTENDPTKNSLAGLRTFVRQKGLTADVLLCPGDLGDKAQPVAIQHAWRELHAIKSELRARDLIPTTGNHDIDSRHAHNNHDAKGMLQALHPAYPFAKTNLNDRYWARHFVVIRRNNYRILVLNSSAFHGEGRFDQTKKHEFEQGRVSDYTLSMIRSELNEAAPPNVNILLCHHHPHPHSELRLGEDDLMIGGRALLDLLGSGVYGRWLVVHGHKHHAKLEYAAGGASPPVIFAAGSVAAVLFRELQTVARNQFYVIEFPLDQFESLGFVGQFQSWDWTSGHGWISAPKGSRLPAHGGFGWRGDINVLARQLNRAVTRTTVKWSVLAKQFPHINYVLPQDLEQLVRLLRADPTLTVEPQDDVPPTLIGRLR